MTELLNFIFNAFIALLLVLTIAYCWVLNRRIRVLQDSRSELAQLIKHFDESTERASASVVGLQSASKRIGEVIQERVEKANFMADDLAFLIEKAAKSADQLETHLADYRAQRRQVAEESAAGGVRRPAPRSLHQAASQSAREVTREFTPASRVPVPRAAEPVIPPQPQRAQASATAHETLSTIQRGVPDSAKENEPSTRARTSATLEALLKRMADRKEGGAMETLPPADVVSRLTPPKKRTSSVPSEPRMDSEMDAARPRSRAEQELLDIIKAGSRV